MRQPRAALRAAEKKVAESSKPARELAPLVTPGTTITYALTHAERLRKAADLLDSGDVEGAAPLVQSVGTYCYAVIRDKRIAEKSAHE